MQSFRAFFLWAGAHSSGKPSNAHRMLSWHVCLYHCCCRVYNWCEGSSGSTDQRAPILSAKPAAVVLSWCLLLAADTLMLDSLAASGWPFAWTTLIPWHYTTPAVPVPLVWGPPGKYVRTLENGMLPDACGFAASGGAVCQPVNCHLPTRLCLIVCLC